jgi:hypothetical protein
MKLSDAKHYRAEAKKCRDAAASAEDSAARLYWQHAERCWLTLANQAEVDVNLLAGRKKAPGLETDSWSDLNLAASGIACFQKEARQAQTVTGLLQRS